MSLPARFLGLMLSFATAGCLQVVETIPIEVGALPYGPTCHSSFGAYYLPRALLRVKANAATDATTLATDSLELGLNMVGDRNQVFCLDYLAQSNSEDKITVQRDTNGLLKTISSNVIDRTPEIAAKLIETGEDLAIAAARSAAVPIVAGDKADLEFDPFNWDELMAVKRALRRFGFCVYIEGYSFHLGSRDPGEALAAGQAWCNQANPGRPQPLTDEFASLPVSPEVMNSGVLYRPNVTYKIVILRRTDPGSRDPWTLFQTKRLDMPNISPVLSVGIERAVFTSRKTALNFNKGVLTDVAIEKKSELVGFVSIPLAAAKAIVDVPGQIVTIRLTDTNNKTALLAAQTQLIEAIAAYKVATANTTIGSLPGRSATLTDRRSAEIYGACQNAGGGPACGALPTQAAQ
jgi:hypothetical protein